MLTKPLSYQPRTDWSPTSVGLDCTLARSADTVIFVDVDGVLNVGARDDSGEGPLLVNDQGISDALKLWGRHKSHPLRDTIARLVAISKRIIGHGESSTYTKLASSSDSDVSDVFVGRLAELIRQAGEHRMVVLSSKWQRYKARVDCLERILSAHLGVPFAFDAKTAAQGRNGRHNDCTPEGRLKTIADFVEGMCAWRGAGAGKLRVLVLEDFHITAMDSWACDGVQMESARMVEQYLHRRLPQDPAQASVRLVHTYDEWTTPAGLLVQIGTGLTQEHFCQAARFLGGSCSHCRELQAKPVAALKSLHVPDCAEPVAALKSLHVSDCVKSIADLADSRKRRPHNFHASHDTPDVAHPVKVPKCSTQVARDAVGLLQSRTIS